MQRLGIRVPPLADEPAHALFARLACAYGQSPPRFARELGLSIHDIRGGTTTEAVAALNGSDPDDLARNTFVRSSTGAAIFRGELFEPRHWQVTGRVCPACLDQDEHSHAAFETPHRRFWWDLVSVAHCPEHGTPLVRECPSGGSAALGSCECEAGLVALGRPASSTSDWSRYIVSRLRGLRHTPVPLLDGLRVPTAIGLALRLARLSKPARSTTSALEAAIGFELARGGRAAIEQVFRDRQTRDPRARWSAVYGAIYSWLSACDDPGCRTVADLVRSYAAENLPIRRSTRILGVPVQNRALIRVSEVARALRLDQRTVSAINQVLTGTARPSSKHVSFEQAQAIENEFRSCVRQTEAARRLGLDRWDINALIHLPGSILPVAAWSTVYPRYVYRRHVECLEALSREPCHPYDVMPPGSGTYRGLYNRGHPYPSSRAAVLNALIEATRERTLSPIGRLRKNLGIHSLIFDQEQARAEVDLRLSRGRSA